MSSTVDQARKLVHRFTQHPLPRGVVSLENHVEDPGDKQEGQHGHALAAFRVDDADDHPEYHGVNQALGILAVIDSAHTGYDAEEGG
jgi:hypothetical protein